jgi:hypothetical protein
MQSADKPDGYYAGCNQALLRGVPPAAVRVLEIGCGDGRLGAALKVQKPGFRRLRTPRELRQSAPRRGRDRAPYAGLWRWPEW